MKTKNIFPNISFNQHLSEVLDHVPSNVIFFKILAGIGVTTLEIEDKSRNSIIIEPNVPVIHGKRDKYKKSDHKILAVYEGVKVEKIVEYLESTAQPKKIMTTPESYLKVKEAMEDLGIKIFDEYFMLFDECERTIQDVSYRSKVLIPIDDFFQFKQKAFVSATPIMPSDPRFKKNGFKAIYLKPDYPYNQYIKLIHTNNVFFSFRRFIEESNQKQYFIFFNSTDTIAHLIRFMNIEDESSIFCAKESMQKLKVNNFKHVSTSLGTFRKYNFLTSRFFSAVDINHIEDPNIVMISDLVRAEHSMIDPASEAVQIIGRFRKEKGDIMFRTVTHILNTNKNLVSKSKEEVILYIKEWENVYRVLMNFLKAATTIEARQVLDEIMQRIDFSRYLNEDGTKNYFMVDNTIFEEQVKSYYKDQESIVAAYDRTNRFKLRTELENYDVDDRAMQKSNPQEPLKSVFEVILPILEELHTNDHNHQFYVAMQMEFLKAEFPKVVSAFYILGLEKCKELGFNHIKIKKAIKEHELHLERTHFGFMGFIENNFSEGEYYSSQSIYNRTSRGLKENKLKLLKPGVKLLKNYCKLSKRVWIGLTDEGKNIMGYQILKIYSKYKK